MICGVDGARRQVAQPWDFSFADFGTPIVNGNSSTNAVSFSFDHAVPPNSPATETEALMDPSLFPDVSDFGFQPQQQQIKGEDEAYPLLSPRFDEYQPSTLAPGTGHESDDCCSSSTGSGASTPSLTDTKPHKTSINKKTRKSCDTKQQVHRKKWTKDEDRLLSEAVKKHGESDFAVVAAIVKSRNTTQCRMRWMHAIRPGIRKGYWKETEDNKLRVWVHAQTDKLTKERTTMGVSTIAATPNDIDWNMVEGYIEGRSIKQCRERWKKNLSPTLKKGPWGPEEDAHIINEQQRIGNKWADISRKLPGRTEHGVKTRWQSLMRVCKRHWTKEEDDSLVCLREDIKKRGRTWDDIVGYFPNRTKNAIMTRFKVLKRQMIMVADK